LKAKIETYLKDIENQKKEVAKHQEMYKDMKNKRDKEVNKFKNIK